MVCPPDTDLSAATAQSRRRWSSWLAATRCPAARRPWDSSPMRERRASTLPDGMAEGCESYLTRVRSLLSRERTRIVAGGRALLALRPCLCRANKWLHDLVARGHVIADRRRVVCAMTYFPRLTRPSAAPSCVVHERCARQNCVSCNLRVCACQGACPGRGCRARGVPCSRCGSSRRFYFRIRTSNVLVSCSTGTVNIDAS